MFSFAFICAIIKINQLYLLNISLSHTLKAFVPYEYGVILSKVLQFFMIITTQRNLIDFFSLYILCLTFKSLL